MMITNTFYCIPLDALLCPESLDRSLTPENAVGLEDPTADFTRGDWVALNAQCDPEDAQIDFVALLHRCIAQLS
jgi:hypothetical protein